MNNPSVSQSIEGCQIIKISGGYVCQLTTTDLIPFGVVPIRRTKDRTQQNPCFVQPGAKVAADVQSLRLIG